MKIAYVIPLQKNGTYTDVNNYRTISLLSVLSKILKKAIYARNINFLNKNNVLYNRQDNFR